MGQRSERVEDVKGSKVGWLEIAMKERKARSMCQGKRRKIRER